MDAVSIVILVAQLAIGALLGLVTWTVRDMRGDQKKRLDRVESRVGALELLVAGQYVPKTECERRHGMVDAKLNSLDDRAGRASVEIGRLKERQGES